uniref:LIM zinc-binding domain-containing protein n=1 Tax=Acrobeloides nanus TaxID=290746 RepID=A0A914DP90_9BILA
MTVDQIKIHKKCFKCGICDYPLQIGYCARDKALEGRYGLYWYCNLEHMLWGPGKKAAELDKLGRGKKNLPLSSPTGTSPLSSPTGTGPLSSPTGTDPLSSPTAAGTGTSPTEAPSGPISMLDAIAARRAGGAGHAGEVGGTGSDGAAFGGPGGDAAVGAFGGVAGGAAGAAAGGAIDGSGGDAAGGTVGGAVEGAIGGAAGGANSGAAGVGDGAAGGAAGGATGGASANSGATIISPQTPVVGKCKACDQNIAMCDDITVDRITIHRNCFKCGICDSKLFPGSCARDQSLEPKYGLKWYCGIHMLLGPGKKADEMEKAGKPKRF